MQMNHNKCERPTMGKKNLSKDTNSLRREDCVNLTHWQQHWKQLRSEKNILIKI